MSLLYPRRDALKVLAASFVAPLLPEFVLALPDDAGLVVGQPQAARAGMAILESGGNAVDAAVTAALVAGVVAVQQCGIGGYGGHMVIASGDGKKITAIDFNSTAPAAARPEMFALNDKGQVKDQRNSLGWLAAGVPGTLAGMQLALDRYGSRPFADIVQPAIEHARSGFEVTSGLATAIRANAGSLRKDAASAKLLLDQGERLQQGKTFRNPDLADMLQKLAERKSVDSFYRGDFGRQIAAEFQKHGGLVTPEDLAAYQAREVSPLALEWRGSTIYTAPLTAGGLTVLQGLAALKALGWETQPAADPRTTHARLEALRVAWDDRLRLLGDPEKAAVPVERQLSEGHARQTARRVKKAVAEGKPLPGSGDGRPAGGTVHLSAVDRNGMMVALTLTHGSYFGAQVTVAGLGLILGHGMSRFDPRPGLPNSIGPGKRPLHNMCPTIVVRDGRPVLALGATGGRKIPNTVLDVLAHYVGRNTSLSEAMAASRLHTEGDLHVLLEPRWPAETTAYLKKVGYDVKQGTGANCNAVERDRVTGTCRPAGR